MWRRGRRSRGSSGAWEKSSHGRFFSGCSYIKASLRLCALEEAIDAPLMGCEDSRWSPTTSSMSWVSSTASEEDMLLLLSAAFFKPYESVCVNSYNGVSLGLWKKRNDNFELRGLDPNLWHLHIAANVGLYFYVAVLPLGKLPLLLPASACKRWRAPLLLHQPAIAGRILSFLYRLCHLWFLCHTGLCQGNLCTAQLLWKASSSNHKSRTNMHIHLGTKLHFLSKRGCHQPWRTKKHTLWQLVRFGTQRDNECKTKLGVGGFPTLSWPLTMLNWPCFHLIWLSKACTPMPKPVSTFPNRISSKPWSSWKGFV